MRKQGFFQGDAKNDYTNKDYVDSQVNVVASSISNVNTQVTSHSAQLAEIAFNVKLFGAKGDGTTDDTAALQTAISAVKTAGGGTLLFPKGTYLISNQLSISSVTHMHCIGAKDGSSIIKRPSGAGNNLLVIDGSNKVTVEGLYFLGTGDVASDLGNLPRGIILSNSNDIRIIDNWFSDLAGFGIEMGNSSYNVQVRGNTLWNIGNSLAQDGAGDGHAISMAYYLTDGTTSIIERVVITNNLIHDCRVRGIEVWTSTGGSVKDVVISNNIIKNTSRTGIAVFHDGTGTINNILIEGNSLDSCGNANCNGSIEILGANTRDVVIKGNSIKSSGSGGIDLDSSTKAILISENVINYASWRGVCIRSTTSLISVLGNVIRNCGNEGIIVAASNCLIKGNICLDNGVAIANNYNGINIDGGINCVAEGNLCKNVDSAGNQHYGMRLAGSGHICVNNNCVGNYTGAITDVSTSSTLANNITT